MKWKDLVFWFGLILSIAIAHHYQPALTDLFLGTCTIILIGYVIDWNLMSSERRAALIANYKNRHGIAQNQPHKVDELLK